MMSLPLVRSLCALLFGWCLMQPGWATDATGLQPVPALRAHVMDETGTLSSAELAALEQQLLDFERQRGAQIVVLLVPSTQSEDIADFSQRVAETWKLGRSGVGDGVLMVLVMQDHRVRIAPYKALEGAIPDVLAKRIIDEQIVPAFRRNDYAGGLQQALLQLQARIGGEALPAPAKAGAQDSGFDLIEGAILLLVAVPLLTAILRRWLGQRLGVLASAAVASGLIWQITHSAWMTLLAGLIGFFGGLLSKGLPVGSTSAGHSRWGHPSHHGGWGSGGFGGGGFGGGDMGGMSSGGGGDAGGGGASGSW
jgi:uncharacterized protein